MGIYLFIVDGLLKQHCQEFSSWNHGWFITQNLNRTPCSELALSFLADLVRSAAAKLLRSAHTRRGPWRFWGVRNIDQGNPMQDEKIHELSCLCSINKHNLQYISTCLQLLCVSELCQDSSLNKCLGASVAMRAQNHCPMVRSVQSGKRIHCCTLNFTPVLHMENEWTWMKMMYIQKYHRVIKNNLSKFFSILLEGEPKVRIENHLDTATQPPRAETTRTLISRSHVVLSLEGQVPGRGFLCEAFYCWGWENLKHNKNIQKCQKTGHPKKMWRYWQVTTRIFMDVSHQFVLYLQPSAFRRPSSLLPVCRLQKAFVSKMSLCKSRACIKAMLV